MTDRKPFLKYERMVYDTHDFPVGTKWFLKDGQVLKQTIYKTQYSPRPGFVILRGDKYQFKEWCSGHGRWNIRWAYDWEVSLIEKIVLPDGTEIVV